MGKHVRISLLARTLEVLKFKPCDDRPADTKPVALNPIWVVLKIRDPVWGPPKIVRHPYKEDPNGTLF